MYLSSIIQNDRDINSDVNHWIQANRLKWSSTRRFLCDHNISLKLKENFYSIAFRLILLYGMESWVIMTVVKMYIAGWMCGNTKRNKSAK